MRKKRFLAGLSLLAMLSCFLLPITVYAEETWVGVGDMPAPMYEDYGDGFATAIEGKAAPSLGGNFATKRMDTAEEVYFSEKFTDYLLFTEKNGSMPKAVKIRIRDISGGVDYFWNGEENVLPVPENYWDGRSIPYPHSDELIVVPAGESIALEFDRFMIEEGSINDPYVEGDEKPCNTYISGTITFSFEAYDKDHMAMYYDMDITREVTDEASVLRTDRLNNAEKLCRSDKFEWGYVGDPKLLVMDDTTTFYMNASVAYVSYDYPLANQEISTDAEKEKGEVRADVDASIVEGHKPQKTEDTSDSSTAVKVIAGTTAALVGGAIVGSGGKDTPPKDEDKKKRRYRMYFRKNFGDTIRYDAAAQPVYARMVEIDEQGREIARDDLTAQIRFFSKDGSLAVQGAGMSGHYASAWVSASAADGTGRASGVLSVSFTGEGGSFQNLVAFRLSGEPRVVFPDMPAYSTEPVLDVIAGDGGTYRMRFFFENAAEEPKQIVFGSYKAYEIITEPAENLYTYYAVVKNLTAPMDNRLIYERYPVELVGFTAIFADGAELKASFMICRYPEGLSVIAKQQGGMIPVQAYEKEYRGDLDPAFQATELRFTYAQRTPGGAEIIEPKEGEISLNNLRGEGAVEKIASTYGYTLSTVNGICYFTPQDMLYETVGGERFPMLIDAAFQNRLDSALTLPLDFIPKKLTPMSSWDVEYDKLAGRLERFALPENKARYVQLLGKLNADNTSVRELRLMSKDLVRAYMRHWALEGEKQMEWENTLGWLEFGAGFIDFIGDCAFTYLIITYGGGPFVEAVLSPAKDLLAEFLGRVGGNILFFGDGVSWDGFLKMSNNAVKSAFDDILYEMIPGKEAVFKVPSIKTVGRLLAAYFMLNFALNFIKNLADRCDAEEMREYERLSVAEIEKRFSYTHNLYEALITTFQDMGKRIVGEMMGKLFKNYMEKPEVGAKIETLMRDFAHWQMIRQIKAEFQAYAGSGSRELFGAAGRYAQYKGFYNEVGEKMIPQAKDILRESVKKLVDKGYGYASEEVRGGFRAASKAVENIKKELNKGEAAINASVAFDTDANGKKRMTTTFTIPGEDIAFQMHTDMDKVFDENSGNPLFRDMNDYILGNVPAFPAPIPMPKEPPLPQGR